MIRLTAATGSRPIADRGRRSHPPAVFETRLDRIDRDDLPRPEVAQHARKQLPHRSLSDDRHVLVEKVRQFLESVDRRPQRLREQGTFHRHARVERNGPFFTDHESLEKTKLIVGHAQHALPRLESGSVRGDDRTDHLMQGVADSRLRLLITAEEKRKVGAAQARQLGLKQDLPHPVSRRQERRLGHVDQFNTAGPCNLGCKQR